MFYVHSEGRVTDEQYHSVDDTEQGRLHAVQSLASPIPSALIANIASASGRHGES